MVAWNFIYVLVFMSVLLMELFTSHLRSLAYKRSSQAKTDVELETHGMEETQAVSVDPRGKTVIDLHRNRGAVGYYLLSISVRILVELCFVYVLLSWNLPALNNGAYKCSTDLCSELHVCVVRAAPEKLFSIYALVSISSMIVLFSVIFFIYSVAHYLFNV